MITKSILIEAPVQRHAFLLANDNHLIVIDPGAKHHAEMLLKGISEDFDIKDIDYIILQSNDYLNITSIESLIHAGFDGEIICNETTIKYIEDVLNHKVKTIAELDYVLKLDDDISLSFIPAPFLPFHEGFVTYDSINQSLYSSHLFSQQKQSDDDTLIMTVNRFHQLTLPSVEFVRQHIRKLRKYTIKTIYPRLGRSIKSYEINDLIIEVMKFDFYNTTQVVEKTNAKNVTYNYEMICNHMLKKLASLYHRSDILSVFQASKINLVLSPDVEIESTELTGYKLWNYFFERIYEQKGVTWLVVLESAVKKYKQLYHIHRPAIYKTQTYLQQSKISKLNEQTGELSEQIKTLKHDLDETSDKLLRCPITNLYNERFMMEYLYKELSKENDNDQTSALVLVYMDDLLNINKKYGTHQGDETIRNLAYVLSNVKDEKVLLFKQNGPGIFCFIQNIKEKNLQSCVLNLRNEVQSSDLFIEPLTVSLSVAEINEIDARYEAHERILQLIDLSLKRMERAKGLGKSQIIDKSQDNQAYIDGRILLVDEDETYQNMMKKIFDRIHYKVIIASDIYDAYQKVQTEAIDIIISEINMSKLDGFQFKHMINQTKDYKDIPFIISSHHKNLEVVTRANLLDVDLILQKPIIPEELLGHINRMRQRRKRL